MSESQQPPDFTKHQQSEPTQQFGGYGDQPRPQYQPYPQGSGQPPAGYGPQPMSPQDQRTWSVVGHLSWLVTTWFGLLPLGALIVYLVFRHRGAFVQQHATEALNFSISITIYSLVSTFLATVIAVLTLGIGAGLFIIPAAIGVVGLVFAIIAAVAAGQGRPYRYPLTLRLVS